MPSVQTVAPSTTAITMDEAKAHLRIDSTEDDSYIRAIIDSATLSIEEFARRALIQQTRRMDLYDFCDEITMDYAPLSSVSGITYTDENGTSGSSLATTVYDVDATSDPGRVLLAYDQTWPTVQAQTFNAVQITYVAGYATGSSAVPGNYKQAIKLVMDRMYNERTDFKTGTLVQALPWAAKDLIRPTRNFRFV